MTSLISLQKISKTFFQGSQRIEVLNLLNLEVSSGQSVAILGQSGSGKSTLLSILAGLDHPEFGSVTFVGFVVQSPEGGQLDPESEFWTRIRTDLTRIKWVNDQVIAMTGRQPGLRIGPGEIILGLSHLVHQVLNPKNRFEFTRERVVATAEANLELSQRIAELFRSRFNPTHPLPEEEFQKQTLELDADIERLASSETATSVLKTMVEALRHTLRTNYYVPGRFGLCLRLDPSFLSNKDRPELPYGVFFVHGRDFNGFHVRFQDIARGGLRVVRPRSQSQMVRESERLYDEVYGLSFAQQLKNKVREREAGADS